MLQLNRRLSRLREAYRHCFYGPTGGEPTAASSVVLADLKEFAGYNRVGGVLEFGRQAGAVDPLATMVAIGRRQMLERVFQMLNLSEREIYTQIRDDED